MRALRLRNDLGREIAFVLEPWGETFPMAPGEVFEVVPEGDLDIDWAEARITVYASPGSAARLFCRDRELGGPRLRVPSIPQGMTMREFVEMMFRRPPP